MGSLSKTIMFTHPVCGFLQVYEAYGQTECTAGCTYTTPGDWTSGEPRSVKWDAGGRNHHPVELSPEVSWTTLLLQC